MSTDPPPQSIPNDRDENSVISILNRRRRHEAIRTKIDLYSKGITKACLNKSALQEAKELVPICELVQDNLDILEGNFEDNLLPVLVNWFANDFFEWFTAPNCERCNQELKYDAGSITQEGNPVEIYKCQNNGCDYTFEFIRHNDPAILLISKKGRCGEWANCFMLILTALDYDARLVLDTTDHVWNEVWSEAQQRWLHVDPCEANVDCPLLYELGWSKQLEYCIAFGPYEVSDVTRRYTVDFEAVKVRRDSCDEGWLERYLDAVTNDLLKNVPQETRDSILDHRRKDVEFLKNSHLNQTEARDRAKFQQRKTGSIAWRIERGEYSPLQKKLFIVTVPATLKTDTEQPMFTLSYNCDKDKYDSSSGDYQTKGWSSLIYMCENLDHKYERDWKTSYISRYETCPWNHEGSIQWRFDFSKLDKWTRLEIQLLAKIYPETTITLLLVTFNPGDEKEFIDKLNLEVDSPNVVTCQQLKASNSIIGLIASLAGGQPGDVVAWQKPQLFRQTRGIDSEFIDLLKSETYTSNLSPQLRKRLLHLIELNFRAEDGKHEFVRRLASVFDRFLFELIQAHYNTKQREQDLVRLIDSKGCTISDPNLTDAVIDILITIYNPPGQFANASFERKVLIKLLLNNLGEKNYGKRQVERVVQTLYKGSCFEVTQRNGASGTLTLKKNLCDASSLRQKHDIELIKFAQTNGIRLSTESWVHLLHGHSYPDNVARMQSLIDKHQTPVSVSELQLTLIKAGDKYSISNYMDVLSLIQDLMKDLSSETSVIDYGILRDIMKNLAKIKHLFIIRQCRSQIKQSQSGI